MSASSGGFLHAANEAQHWVNQIDEELGWGKPQAHRALRAVLHALRDFLPLTESADLASQLPMLVRGIYFENWKPGMLSEGRSKRDFVLRVAAELGHRDHEETEPSIEAVFALLSMHVSPGEVNQAMHALGKDIQMMWPQ